MIGAPSGLHELHVVRMRASRRRALGSPRPSQSKREKERARQGRNQLKNERRAQRRVERAERPVTADGEDPDIAGIVPGPQPRLDEDSEGPRGGG